jgi:hypothetical protein
MTLQEKLHIGVQAIELEKQGKVEEGDRLRRSIPLSPWLAEWGKKYMGADFLINGGWNLSEAEAVHGHDWLSREGF